MRIGVKSATRLRDGWLVRDNGMEVDWVEERVTTDMEVDRKGDKKPLHGMEIKDETNPTVHLKKRKRNGKFKYVLKNKNQEKLLGEDQQKLQLRSGLGDQRKPYKKAKRRTKKEMEDDREKKKREKKVLGDKLRAWLQPKADPPQRGAESKPCLVNLGWRPGLEKERGSSISFEEGGGGTPKTSVKYRVSIIESKDKKPPEKRTKTIDINKIKEIFEPKKEEAKKVSKKRKKEDEWDGIGL